MSQLQAAFRAANTI